MYLLRPREVFFLIHTVHSALFFCLALPLSLPLMLASFSGLSHHFGQLPTPHTRRNIADKDEQTALARPLCPSSQTGVPSSQAGVPSSHHHRRDGTGRPIRLEAQCEINTALSLGRPPLADSHMCTMAAREAALRRLCCPLHCLLCPLLPLLLLLLLLPLSFTPSSAERRILHSTPLPPATLIAARNTALARIAARNAARNAACRSYAGGTTTLIAAGCLPISRLPSPPGCAAGRSLHWARVCAASSQPPPPLPHSSPVPGRPQENGSVHKQPARAVSELLVSKLAPSAASRA